MPESVKYLDGMKLSYSYDNRGNISSISRDGVIEAKYEYDKLDRLTREDNSLFEKSYFYSYDNNGNITCKEVRPYAGENGTVISYTYDKDRLTSYNGEACVYDIMGNPTTYRGKSATWKYGRRLISFDGNTFKYDGQGHRIEKNGITFTYDSQNRLIKQSNGLEFFYDNTGLLGLKYNSKTYIYQKDIQGNIIAVLDSNGNVVVEYFYDAWGNHEVSGSLIIGNLNPFRYRSYYFDTETNLYYLQTRYYDPEVGRFLNMDSPAYADPETINGLNLYSYCNNNPVMNIDPDGHAFLSILIAMGIGFLIGGAIGGGFEIGKQIYSNGWNPTDWDWQQIGLSALGGAVAGMISSIPIGGLSGAIIFGGMGSVAGGLITGSVNSWETALLAFGIGAIANVAAYGINNKLANVKAGKIFNQGNKAKSLAVQKLQGHPLNMGVKALKGSFRNAFKQTTQSEIVKLINNTNPWFKYGVYSAIFSCTLSGWY